MRFKKLLTALLAIIILALMFVSCSNSEDSIVSDPSEQVTKPTDAITEPKTDPPTQPPTEPEPEGEYNYLTGLYDLEEGALIRPIAFMIGNNPPSRPQYGINQADMFFESETEGGITRIMAVFTSIDKVPEQIGPIRSGRTPFINLANALDAIYVHCGASIMGFQTIKDTGISDLDALYSSDFWRDPYLRDNKGYEYSLMTGRENLYDTITGGYRIYDENSMNVEPPFEFEEQKSTSLDATKIELEPSNFETVSFTYDVANNTYYKQLGTLDNAQRHVLADGSDISVENIIAIYDDQYWENEVTINYNLISGSAKLFTGGTIRDINWSRNTKQLSFFETDGSKAKLNPGKTYVVIASHSHEDDMKYY